MDFGHRLADLAMDRRITIMGSGRNLSDMAATHLSWMDEIRTSRQPGHDSDNFGDRFLSHDNPDLVLASARGKRPNATKV